MVTGFGGGMRDDKNVLKLTVVMAEQLCKYTKTTERSSISKYAIFMGYMKAT